MLRMEGKEIAPAAPLREKSKCHSSPRTRLSLLQRNRTPVLFAYLTPDFFLYFLPGN